MRSIVQTSVHQRGVLFTLRLFGVARNHLRVGEVARFLFVSRLRLLCMPLVYFVAFLALFIYCCLSIKKKTVQTSVVIKNLRSAQMGINFFTKILVPSQYLTS